MKLTTTYKLNFFRSGLIAVLALLFNAGCNVDKEYNILDYGAVADGTTLNTEAIQEAIDEAESKGGGTIVVPEGEFLSGALFFKEGTRLKIHENGVLKGSDNIDHYPMRPSRMEGQLLDYIPALVNAYDVDGFSITGPGKIDGNGLKFWKAFWDHREKMESQGKEWTNLEVHRPRLVFIWGCDNVVIEDVKLHDSGFWTTHLYQCNNVKILNADIRAPMEPVPAPSSDAIDIDVCENVLIKGCYLSVNDDAIAIKGGKGPYADEEPGNGPIKNVVVEDCTFGPSHGGITLGSECIHGSDIIVRNCVFESNAPLLRLKIRPDTPQLYENITIENITGSCIELISVKPWTQFFDLQGRETPPQSVVKNITFRDINMESTGIGIFKMNEGDDAENITFQDVHISKTDSMRMVTYRPKGFDFDSLGNLDFSEKKVAALEKDYFETDHKDAFTFKNVTVNGEEFVLE